MQCTRGFSYMPQKLTDPTDLKLVEPEELDRNWRSARRECLKQQEKKIYEEFVQEKDVVISVLEDDMYQFIYELPETCVSDFIEQTPKPTEKKEESDTQDSPKDPDAGTETEGQSGSALHCFQESDNNEIFHIYDDDASGDEHGLDSVNGSVCTVREKASNTDLNANGHDAKSDWVPANAIENSIYCAKVKDLRLKIGTQLKEIYTELEDKVIKNMDTDSLKKIMKCATEFCARFNRVHMYQMKRQISDIERHNSQTLPFAKHTQFQSQMVRIISLHQNLLHALQVFHKSYEQTLYLRECVPVLRAVAQLVRTITDHCLAVECPPDFAAAREMYCDDVPKTAERLEGTLEAHASRLAAMLSGHQLADPATKQSATKVSLTGRDKRRLHPRDKRAEVESRLKMYSLDVRRNPHVPRLHALVYGVGVELKPASLLNKEKKEESKKEKVKAVKENEPVKKKESRRPLMRGPNSVKGPPKKKMLERDSEIKTMVESFNDAASSGFIGDEKRKGSETNFNLKTKNQNLRSPHGWPRKEAAVPSNNVTKLTSLRLARPIERSPRDGSPKSSPKRRERKIFQAVNKILSPLMADPRAANVARVQQIKVNLSPKSPPTGRHSEPEESSHQPSPRSLREDHSSKINKSTQGGKKEMVSPKMTTPVDALKDRKNIVAKVMNDGPQQLCETREVSQLLRRLCCGDANQPRMEERSQRHERVTGARNAQLVCTSSASPRSQPSTAELLRILEETIKKKTPRQHTRATLTSKDLEEKMRLAFNIPERITDSVLQYRTKFVQHMLASPLYANSVVGRPWEVVSSVSEEMIEEMLLRCTMDMEIQKVIRDIYVNELY